MSLETRHTGSLKQGRARWLIGALLVMLAAGDAMADGMGHRVGHHGWVMARSMVLDDDGQPILVEYNDQGEEVRELSLPGGYQNRVGELEVFSGHSYRSQKERLDMFRNNEAPSDARLLPRDQVEGGSFPLANGEGSVTVSASDLHPGTQSVLVQGRSNTLTDNVDQFILQEYSFDFTQSADVDGSVRSVLVNPTGQVVATSPYTVAPRVGFFGSDSEGKSGSKRFDPQSDEIFGPVSGAQVFANDMTNPQASDITNEKGHYSFGMFMPCIPGGITFVTAVQARLEFRSFNPLDDGVRPYFLKQRSFTHCSWTPVAPTNLTAASLDSQGAFESAPETMHRVNLYVDVMMLTGEMTMRNPPRDLNKVRIQDKTRYGSFEFRDDKVAPATWYDFDNDGARDRAVIGRQTDEDGFVEDESGSLQGVYFSSTDEGPDADQQPDIVRLLHENRQRRVEENTGMLRSITKEDLQNTDLLVFRAATGELIVERQGLSDDELGAREIGVDDGGRVGYRLLMRGPQGSGVGAPNIANPGSFKDWATDYQLEEPFQSKDSFHLQPGEWVEVVAINRTTGYIGTQRVQLTSAANSDSQDLSVVVDEITLRPPNLRVWAERDYTVEKGAEAGDEREGQIIGAEGSSLQSDEQIIIYTEWLDHDGSALPEGLGVSNGESFGLTGRLTKVVGNKDGSVELQSAESSADIAEFPISPGNKQQVVKFKDDQIPPEHYYLHVIGQPLAKENCQGSSCADFDTTGFEAGLQAPFDTRPRYVTPFLTPHYDEKTDWLGFNEYRRQKKDLANSEQDLAELQRPTPTYAWNYRPEYQFSRYQLAVDEVNRGRLDEETGDSDKEAILDDPAPTLSSGDDMLEILYSLVEPEHERLAPIDGDQNLVLALGEHETRVKLGEDQQIQWENLDHLDQLEPEDFLSLKLYQNEDAANILWEFAFARIGIHLDANHDGVMNEASVDPDNLDLNDLSEQDKQDLADSDHVSSERPFRFWLNNDYDVVVDEPDINYCPPDSGPAQQPGCEEENGVEAKIQLDRKSCPPRPDEGNVRDQTCVEDQLVVMNSSDVQVTNSDAEHRERIESLRDLEDFAPMVIRLDEATYDKIVDDQYKVIFKANTIGINLFKGTWEQEPNRNDHKERCDDFVAGDAPAPGVDIRRHMKECEAAFAQAADGLHVVYLNGQGDQQASTEQLGGDRIEELFEADERKNGFKANILFEAVKPCASDVEDCYFELRIVDTQDNGKVIARSRTHMDLQPIKSFYDHFTAGTWIECKDGDESRDDKKRCKEDPTNRIRDLYDNAKNVHAGEADSPVDMHNGIDRLEGAVYEQSWQAEYDYRPLFRRLEGDEPQAESSPYVLFVHGWRMPYAARVAYAETTMKRLYWQGYRGRFGTFSWPTGWFPRSTNASTVTTLLEVFTDINNYSRSERIARDTGPVLTDKLAELNTEHNVHLLAHSMGNVVASEALREAPDGDQPLLSTYVATQAATAAGAYAPHPGDSPKMFVDPVGGKRDDIDRGEASWFWAPFALASDWAGGLSDDDCLGPTNFDRAWRCNNFDEPGWYNVPPDWYREQPNTPRKHPERTQQRAYYDLIATKVEGDRIINFFNEADSALDGWNAQQITKPDIGQQVTGGSASDLLFGDIMWGWDHKAVVQNEQACSDKAMDCEVSDRFRSPQDGEKQDGERAFKLDWSERWGRHAILSMILPSRTYALGASEGLGDVNQSEIEEDFNLRDELQYTNSDFDHSAQWLDSYTEQQGYWGELHGQFFGSGDDEQGEEE